MSFEERLAYSQSCSESLRAIAHRQLLAIRADRFDEFRLLEHIYRAVYRTAMEVLS